MRKHNTEVRNRTYQKKRLCRTIVEQLVYEALIVAYKDVQYDIRVDDRYPYFCDFYIPSSDLFIELNAHPSHGILPYDMMKFEDYSNLPNKWVDVFARRDVEKLKKAKDSNINYLRIYPQASIYDNYRLNNNKFEDIVNICYRACHKSRRNLTDFDK